MLVIGIANKGKLLQLTIDFFNLHKHYLTNNSVKPTKMIDVEEKVETKTELKILECEERQTIVHCSCGDDYAYRIWPSTFLIEHGTGKQAKLITAFNIPFAPQWALNDGRGFTLIFEGLSKGCKSFDLKEIIAESNGFEAYNIKRNKTDVYRVKF